jgi:hypothetical protein
MAIDAADRDRLRDRLGPVGVWLTLLGLSSAAEERAAAAEIERLGYPALWFGETPVNKEAFGPCRHPARGHRPDRDRHRHRQHLCP